MRVLRGVIPFFVIGIFMVPISCNDTVDCLQICNRYSECVTDIDVTECTDLCEDASDNDDAVRAQANRCEDCLNGGACAEIQGCFDDCPVYVTAD